MELEDGSTLVVTLPAGAEDLDVSILRPGENPA
jgi:hypothetical protein